MGRPQYRGTRSLPCRCAAGRRLRPASSSFTHRAAGRAARSVGPAHSQPLPLLQHSDSRRARRQPATGLAAAPQPRPKAGMGASWDWRHRDFGSDTNFLSGRSVSMWRPVTCLGCSFVPFSRKSRPVHGLSCSLVPSCFLATFAFSFCWCSFVVMPIFLHFIDRFDPVPVRTVDITAHRLILQFFSPALATPAAPLARPLSGTDGLSGGCLFLSFSRVARPVQASPGLGPAGPSTGRSPHGARGTHCQPAGTAQARTGPPVVACSQSVLHSIARGWAERRMGWSRPHVHVPCWSGRKVC